jgi:hypothetical protein
VILVVCLDCQERREHEARGICPRCYQCRITAGTIDERPPLGTREGGGLASSPLQFGITYRQLDYWVRQGYLVPNHASPGSGSWRSWPEPEMEVARMMGVLVTAGLRPEAAARVARGGALAPGVQLVIDPAVQDGDGR